MPPLPRRFSSLHRLTRTRTKPFYRPGRLWTLLRTKIVRCIISKAGGERFSTADYPIVVIGYSMGEAHMYGVTSPCFETLNLEKSSSKVVTLAWSVTKKRAQRLVHDTQWAKIALCAAVDWGCFRRLVPTKRLFSSLNHEQRQTLVIKRSGNLELSVANIFIYLLRWRSNQITMLHWSLMSIFLHYVWWKES